MPVDEMVTIDPEILGGTPVILGTRVPVKSLFEYLEDNYTLEQFTEFLPTVTVEMARQLLERSESGLLEFDSNSDRTDKRSKKAMQ